MNVVDIRQYRVRRSIRELEKKIETHINYPVTGSVREIKQCFISLVQKRK